MEWWFLVLFSSWVYFIEGILRWGLIRIKDRSRGVLGEGSDVRGFGIWLIVIF